MTEARKIGASAKQAGNRGLGRKKGTPNKINAALKDMILGALSDAGGQAYLAGQAAANPNAFMALVGRVLPLDTNLNHSGTVGIIRYPGLDD
jgi:hypothetical protein